MSPEALALGALSAARATPLAIVYALLLAERPRRLVGAYTAAGVLVSLALGLAVVMLFNGSSRSSGQTTTRDVIDLVLGVAGMGYAAGYARGWFGARSRPVPERSPGPSGRVGELLRSPSAPLAVVAGGLTNLPGLFFLAGLVAILDTHPSALNGAVQVGVYTALRLATPIAALVLVTLRPERTLEVVDAVRDFGVRHKRVLIIGSLAVVGAYLAVKGLLGLLA